MNTIYIFTYYTMNNKSHTVKKKYHLFIIKKNHWCRTSNLIVIHGCISSNLIDGLQNSRFYAINWIMQSLARSSLRALPFKARLYTLSEKIAKESLI